MMQFSLFGGEPSTPIIILPPWQTNLQHKVETTPKLTRRELMRQRYQERREHEEALRRGLVGRVPVEIDEDEDEPVRPVHIDLPQPIPVIRPRPNVVDEPRNAEPIALHAGMTEGQKMEAFWKIVQTFGWRNRSDGGVNGAGISRYLNALPGRDVFKDIYLQLAQSTEEILQLDGMFERNNVIDRRGQIAVITHMIGLGGDTYNNLITDLEFYQYLVDTKEYQSLDDCMPGDMKI